MNKFSSSLILLIISLSLHTAISQNDIDVLPPMTTSEPIVTVQDDGTANYCSSYQSCGDCVKANCTWLVCPVNEQYCDTEPVEFCSSMECSDNTTTTPPTTTTISPNTTTTISPNTTTEDTTTTVTTTEPPTTTDNTTTTTPATTTTTTTAPNTTTSTSTTTTTTTTPTTNATTTIAPNSTTIPTTTTSSTTTVAPPQRHFDAGSFVGGMILALTLTAVAFAGWKFYRRRALSTSYTNF